MVLLQPKLNLKVSQKQILTPGLVQMVSVLALNKLELKDMINAEIVENPVLEELDSTVPLIDDIASREEDRERAPAADEPIVQAEKKDPFDEIDFGSFFQDYLDPGYRSQGDIESVEKPSFENFLSRPTTLTDHLMWQLGALSVRDKVRAAAEMIIGDLNEDGYLIASDDELLAAAREGGAKTNGLAHLAPEPPSTAGQNGAGSLADVPGDAVQVSDRADSPDSTLPSASQFSDFASGDPAASASETATAIAAETPPSEPDRTAEPVQPTTPAASPAETNGAVAFDRADLQEALELVRQMDPVGVACRDLRECLLAQLKYHQQTHHQVKNGNGSTEQLLKDCVAIVSDHLKEVQNKQYKEIAKAIGRSQEAVMQAMDFIKTLDPRPGLRYNKVQARL